MPKDVKVPDAAEVLGGSGSRLKDEAAKILGAASSAKFGAATVSQVGFEFIEGNKAQTAWVTSLTSPETVAAALIARGIYNMREAYRATNDKGQELFLSKFHTQRCFGKAPQLRVNDVVDVYVVANPKSESKFAFAYQRTN